MRSSRPKPKPGILGLAFDAEDGQKRITRADNFVLLGGSQDTHAVMQETAIKVNEKLQQRGKRLEDVSATELVDIFRDVTER